MRWTLGATARRGVGGDLRSHPRGAGAGAGAGGRAARHIPPPVVDLALDISATDDVADLREERKCHWPTPRQKLPRLGFRDQGLVSPARTSPEVAHVQTKSPQQNVNWDRDEAVAHVPPARRSPDHETLQRCCIAPLILPAVIFFGVI
jgi:hypothetical protein